MASTHDRRTLLSRVRTRLRLLSAARRGWVALLALCGLYLTALLAQRLLAAFPDVFAVWMPAVLPPVAALLGLILHHRVTAAEAARRADEAAGTKDLFLAATLSATDEAAGQAAYAPLVDRAADERAAKLKPAALAPFQPARRLAIAAGLVALLTLGTATLPSFDPFGKAKQADELAKLKEDLLKTKKALELREVNMAKPEQALTSEVKRSLEKLKQTFDSLRPQATNENQRALAESRKQLGDQWKKLNEQGLKDVLQSAAEKQKFGMTSPKMEQWKEQLAEGKTGALENELKELQKMAEEMRKASDPEKKARMSEEMKQRLQEIQSFAKQNMEKSPLAQQMGQCQNQLQAAQMDQLAQQAMQNLQQQLQQSQQDMQSLAEQLQSMQDLEEALKAIQQAQQCNKEGKCDGQQTGAFESLAQYAEWYKKMSEAAAKAGDQPGKGEGMKGPGQGEGGLAETDPNAQTNFTPEKAPTLLGAGKVLMEWKTKEIAPTGNAREEYARNVQALKQNVNEALVEEQIPPGYHEAIQQYFDRLPEKSAPAPASATPAVEPKEIDL